MRIRVRYFAAAKAAMGLSEEIREVANGCTIQALLDDIGGGKIPVFNRSSFIVNAVATRDRERVLQGGDELDVLPPFAGG